MFVDTFVFVAANGFIIIVRQANLKFSLKVTFRTNNFRTKQPHLTLYARYYGNNSYGRTHTQQQTTQGDRKKRRRRTEMKEKGNFSKLNHSIISIYCSVMLKYTDMFFANNINFFFFYLQLLITLLFYVNLIDLYGIKW